VVLDAQCDPEMKKQLLPARVLKIVTKCLQKVEDLLKDIPLK